MYGSIKKNKTILFAQKCEFGDYHELSIIKKLSDKNNLLFIDCGCNYGFYSFYTASLSKKIMLYPLRHQKILLKNLLRI